jgi:ANTAR domain/GAF domain
MATPAALPARQGVPQPAAPMRLAEAIRVVAETRTTTAPFDVIARRVAHTAQAALVPHGDVGLQLIDGRGRPLPPVSTGQGTAPADLAQYETQVGPCWAALRDRRVVRIHDVPSESSTWPSFAAAVAAAGVGAVLVVPLTTPCGDAIGTLTLYGPDAGTLDRGCESAGERLAGAAAVTLADARAYGDHADRLAGLEHAMASRAVIEQAKGMIMVTGGCGPDEAFARLVATSQRTNRKLRDIARLMVEGAGHRRDSAPGGATEAARSAAADPPTGCAGG